jgi:group I intron endonuclease
MKNSKNVIYPTLFYENSDVSKKDIYKDNRKKTGVYRWINKISGKTYIGSALNISERLVKYYSLSCLIKETKRNNSAIYKALLNYGHSTFKFEILEHCTPKVLIEREQYYLDLLKPEYNILKIAGSRKGSMHSEATKELQRMAIVGRKLSLETKLKMAHANIKSQPIIITNKETGEK